MPRLCSVCSHPQRQTVDVELMRHTASYRVIARRFQLEADALMRHEHHHLRTSLRESRGLAAMLSAENLLDRLNELDDQTRVMLARALEAGDLRIALAAVRESRETILAYARVGPFSDLERRLEALEQEEEHR